LKHSRAYLHFVTQFQKSNISPRQYITGPKITLAYAISSFMRTGVLSKHGIVMRSQNTDSVLFS